MVICEQSFECSKSDFSGYSNFVQFCWDFMVVGAKELPNGSSRMDSIFWLLRSHGASGLEVVEVEVEAPLARLNLLKSRPYSCSKSKSLKLSLVP